jgi:catechol 2,3-dioxygenase-like lactoylglutathione lyase family enzyme
MCCTLEDGDLVAPHSHVRQKPDDRAAALVHLFRFEGDRMADLCDIGQPCRPNRSTPTECSDIRIRTHPASAGPQETDMLGNNDAVANVAVKDLDVATDFYRKTLGLKPVHQEGKELVVFQSGHSSINVYRSEYAGTNKATAVTWTVDNVEDEVKALRNKGVVFEHYDMPGMKHEGDVHVGGHMKVAWFKDPDGNILNVVGR